MDLQILTSEFLASKAASGRSPATIYNYQWNLESFLAWCNQEGFTGNDLVGAIGAETIEAHMLYMAICDYRPHTITQRYRSLRAFYRWVESRHGPMYAGNPFAMLTMPTTPDLLPKAISYSEFTVLLHTISGQTWTAPRDRLLIKMLFYTGMRLSEVTALCVEDVNVERRELRIYRQKIKSEGFIPLSRSLCDDLRAWLDELRPVCSHNGLWPTLLKGATIGPAPMGADGITEMLRRRCRVAKLPQYCAHAFRHGCAAEIVRRGGDLSLVKDLLGHRDIATTQVYLRFDLGRLTSQYDRIFE